MASTQTPGTEERADPYEVLYDPWMQAVGQAVFEEQTRRQRAPILCAYQPWGAHDMGTRRLFMEQGARIMVNLAQLTGTTPNPLCTQLLELPDRRQRDA